MSRVRKLTTSALLAALGVLVLLFSSLLPTMALPFAAFAGLLPAAVVLHCGLGWGLGSAVVTATLALLLLPNKTGAVWYAVFFGHYPVVKSLLERISKQILCWLAKLGVFAVCTAALYFLLRGFFFAALPEQALWILLPALTVGFILYDIAFSALVSVYSRRIAPHVDTNFRRR